MTFLELDDKEKNIFFSLLQQRQKAISEEMEVLKTLFLKLDTKQETKKVHEADNSHQPVAKIILKEKEDDFSSWVITIKKELAYFSNPVVSGDIVKHLLQNPVLAAKGKRFVTKAVTSKLWLLQERGEVIKEKENGKYVYSLKK